MAMLSQEQFELIATAAVWRSAQHLHSSDVLCVQIWGLDKPDVQDRGVRRGAHQRGH